MNDYAEAQLAQFIEQTGKDLDVADVKPAFDEKIETVEEKAMEALDEQTKIDYAIGMMGAEDLRDRRVGSSGEELNLKILSIGHRGVFSDWSPPGADYDVDTVMSHAIIHGHLNGRNEDPVARKAILFNKAEDLNLHTVQDKFYPLAELEATYKVEEAWNLDGFYRCYSTDATEIEETEIDELPSDRDDKNELLRQMFPDVELAGLAENKTGLSSFHTSDNGRSYTDDWGADIKRFTGTINDNYIPDDRSWGRYTIIDDSVTEDDLEGTEVVSDSQNVPGLTVWCEPDYHMNFGNQSIVDVYGTVETGKDGQIQMSAVGIVPIVPMGSPGRDDDEADADVDATTGSI